MYKILNTTNNPILIYDFGTKKQPFTVILEPNRVTDLHKASVKINPERSSQLKSLIKNGYVRKINSEGGPKLIENETQDNHPKEKVDENKILNKLLSALPGIFKDQMDQVKDELKEELAKGNEAVTKVLSENQPPKVIYASSEQLMQDDDDLTDEEKKALHSKAIQKSTSNVSGRKISTESKNSIKSDHQELDGLEDFI